MIRTSRKRRRRHDVAFPMLHGHHSPVDWVLSLPRMATRQAMRLLLAAAALGLVLGIAAAWMLEAR